MDLVELRMWPGTTDEANKQHINTIIPLANLKEFAPDENSIFFYPPPFTRISNALSNEYEYWKKNGALDQIDPNLALIIADFGMGSDTVLTLDYRENITIPTVCRLKWDNENGNRWLKVADNFATFCRMAGLDNLKSG